MGPFPPSVGNLYILLAMDYVSKWVEAAVFPKMMLIQSWGFYKRTF